MSVFSLFINCAVLLKLQLSSAWRSVALEAVSGADGLAAKLLAPVCQLWCYGVVMAVQGLLSGCVSPEGFYRHLFVNVCINIYKIIYIYEYLWGVCIYIDRCIHAQVCVRVHVRYVCFSGASSMVTTAAVATGLPDARVRLSLRCSQ